MTKLNKLQKLGLRELKNDFEYVKDRTKLKFTRDLVELKNWYNKEIKQGFTKSISRDMKSKLQYLKNKHKETVMEELTKYQESRDKIKLDPKGYAVGFGMMKREKPKSKKKALGKPHPKTKKKSPENFLGYRMRVNETLIPFMKRVYSSEEGKDRHDSMASQMSNIIIDIHKNLNPKNKRKLENMSIDKALDVALKLGTWTVKHRSGVI